jgi:hypothetical protein
LSRIKVFLQTQGALLGEKLQASGEIAIEVLSSD